MSETPTIRFDELDLPKPILKALDDVGYENPSPIQAACIPPILEGRDIIGQAQTGTGKTAGFALPILAQLDLKQKDPQVLVLAPTRELAIQVAEAFQKYASHLKGFHVAPIYGGTDYSGQLRQLRRGVHVVVGTPGRVMDHMRKGTLDLSNLKHLVLDEADEMLRMGFVDDVEWILEQCSDDHRTALFSATMPTAIKRIAKKYLNNPAEIIIKNKTATTSTIDQKYWVVNGRHKLDALTRILEFEPFDGMLIFVRTKTATTEVADKLEARGYSSAALNGDIPQARREKIIEKLKAGKLDIVVATDVAARGLDVNRISIVVNYDIPYDTESYVHRIGRTGRAGRSGKAILFVAPREKRMLASIEKATRQKIDLLEMPTTKDINNQRIEKFKQKISDTISAGNLKFYIEVMEQFQLAHDASGIEIAAALAKMAQGDQELLIEDKPHIERAPRDDGDGERGSRGGRDGKRGRKRDSDRDFERKGDRKSGRGDKRSERGDRNDGKKRARKNENREATEGMSVYRIEVGHDHEVMPKNIVGAIANEIDLSSSNIGHITILDDHSTVELPNNLEEKDLKKLKRVWVSHQQLDIQLLGEGGATPAEKRSEKKKFKKDGDKKNDKGKRNARKMEDDERKNKGKRKPKKKKGIED
ncbi:MAG: DEAD/DEAH box helicase [Planctomycetes bacterium]|nr:DEAD/DEAH box helicase [Planctomycetota bacterium]